MSESELCFQCHFVLLVQLVFIKRPYLTQSLQKAMQKRHLIKMTRPERMCEVTLRPSQSSYESRTALLRFFIAFEMVEDVVVAMAPLCGIE